MIKNLLIRGALLAAGVAVIAVEGAHQPSPGGGFAIGMFLMFASVMPREVGDG